MKQTSHSQQQTEQIAATLATSLKPGLAIALSGDLGAGKSVFARAVMRALGVTDEALPSPTFAIIQEYQGSGCRVAHMDWYRLDDPDEIEMLGIRDYLQAPWISLIEWPERAPELLSTHTIRIHLSVGNSEDQRNIEITGNGESPA